MKSRSLVCIATIAAMGFGTVAQAQQWRGGEGHAQRQQERQQARVERHAQTQVQAQPQQHWQQRQQWQQPTRQWQQPRQQWNAPAYQQRYVQPGYHQPYNRVYNQPYQYRAYNNYAPQYHAYNNYAPRAYGNYGHYGHYGSHYYVGGYAPVYASHRYWINDWRARNLYAPPYGYQWVETDTGDVLLLALATGLIANAILAQ
jgi:Ni/Co efflux regulator RcnB